MSDNIQFKYPVSPLGHSHCPTCSEASHCRLKNPLQAVSEVYESQGVSGVISYLNNHAQSLQDSDMHNLLYATLETVKQEEDLVIIAILNGIEPQMLASYGADFQLMKNALAMSQGVSIFQALPQMFNDTNSIYGTNLAINGELLYSGQLALELKHHVVDMSETSVH